MVLVMINFKVNQVKIDQGYCNVFGIIEGDLYD